MKKIVLLLVVLSLLTLVSCSDKNEWALKAGDTTLSKGTFHAQAVTYKNDFLQTYLGMTDDYPALWNQPSPENKNETVGQVVMRMALEDMTQFAWVVEYAKDNGATLTEEEIKSIDDSFNELKNKFDKEEDFNEYVEKLGVTPEELKEHLESTLYYDKGFNDLIAEDGQYPVSDEDLWNYYETNFYTVKHIFFNNINNYDADGNPVEMTEAQKEEKMEKAKKVLADLDEGVSFDSLYMLSEDGASTSYPNGMTFGVGLTTDISYEEAVMNMQVGEYKIIEPMNGGIYVVMRTALDESAFEEYEQFVFGAVCQEITESIYNDHKDEVKVNLDVINSLDVTKMAILG